MLSKNDILVSEKAKKGGIQVTVQKVEDVKDTALKLDEIRTQHPEDYFYIKGWIHCLLQKAEINKSGGQKNGLQTNAGI